MLFQKRRYVLLVAGLLSILLMFLLWNKLSNKFVVKNLSLQRIVSVEIEAGGVTIARLENMEPGQEVLVQFYPGSIDFFIVQIRFLDGTEAFWSYGLDSSRSRRLFGDRKSIAILTKSRVLSME